MILTDDKESFLIECTPTGFAFYAYGKKVNVVEFRKTVRTTIRECRC